MKDLTKYLDPSGLGVISFEDFYQGITAIRNGGQSSLLCASVASPLPQFHNQPSLSLSPSLLITLTPQTPFAECLPFSSKPLKCPRFQDALSPLLFFTPHTPYLPDCLSTMLESYCHFLQRGFSENFETYQNIERFTREPHMYFCVICIP